MTSKPKTPKKMVKQESEMNPNTDYTLYKYSDIESSWILFQGHLNYRYDQIKFLNMSQFAIYYAVLAKIPIDNYRHVMTIYLFRNQKQKPSIFFQLNEYNRIIENTPKPIKSKYVLFSLIGNEENDYEVFGAHDAMERDKWMKCIGQALNSTELLRDRPMFKKSWKENTKTMEHVDADVRLNYEPFVENSTPSMNDHKYDELEEQDIDSIAPHPPFQWANRPAPPIPLINTINSTPQHPIAHRSPTDQHIYLGVKDSSPYMIHQEQQDEKDLSKTLEDRPFTWNDIFYSNDLDDHARILNDIGQIGAFLVRPQLKQSSSPSHDHTLSIFAFGGIIKYKIFKLPKMKLSLAMNGDEPDFLCIADLCQYYTNHALPLSASKDDIVKRSLGNLSLKWPYTFYWNQSNEY